MSVERSSALIVDDHVIIRSSLRSLLEKIGIDEIEEADNGLDAIGQAKVMQPSLMILDVAMPHAGGLEVFTEVRRWSPETRIVVFTGMTSATLMAQLVENGVHGLFLKSDEPNEIEAGLSAVLTGGRIISAQVQLILESDTPAMLTRRESEILQLLVSGMTNAEIGERLSISPNTVNNHRANLMAKLDVHSISELLALALREGLLDEHKTT